MKKQAKIPQARPVNSTTVVLEAPAPVFLPNNGAIARDAQGHALCRKCQAPYSLPEGCTSWRSVGISMLKHWKFSPLYDLDAISVKN